LVVRGGRSLKYICELEDKVELEEGLIGVAVNPEALAMSSMPSIEGPCKLEPSIEDSCKLEVS
jgi:hypothetical protein